METTHLRLGLFLNVSDFYYWLFVYYSYCIMRSTGILRAKLSKVSAGLCENNKTSTRQ